MLKDIVGKFLGLVLLCATFFFSHNKAFSKQIRQVSGKIAQFQNSEPIVQAQPLAGVQTHRLLESPFVRFINLPEGMETDTSGCFCFDVKDFRFQFVHVLWHATKQIVELNQLLEDLGLRPLPQLVIQMEKADESLGQEGSAQLAGIKLTAGPDPMDPGIVAHEIGHWAHYQLIGASRVNLHANVPFSWRADAERSGVVEGIANFLAAMAIRDSHVQKISLPELPYDVNTFVQMPSRFIPRIFGLTTLYASERIRVKAPKFHGVVAETLAKYHSDAEIKHYLDQPDEYLSSAAFNQPVWTAALEFGREEVMLVYLVAASRLKGVSASGYADFAHTLVHVARERGALGGKLERHLIREFSNRGLYPVLTSELGYSR